MRGRQFTLWASRVVFDSHQRSRHEAALEVRLRQAAKLEALGVLVGGLAHDFNNVLATVLGNAELAIKRTEEKNETYPMLTSIATASRSAADLCNQMLAYAGRGTLSTQRLEFNGMIRELGSLLLVALSKKATLTYDLCTEKVYVEADKAQLDQVIMNLITNAAEALENTAGTIVAKTRVQNYTEHELKHFETEVKLPAGEYVCWTVPSVSCSSSQRAFAIQNFSACFLSAVSMRFFAFTARCSNALSSGLSLATRWRSARIIS